MAEGLPNGSGRTRFPPRGFFVRRKRRESARDRDDHWSTAAVVTVRSELGLAELREWDRFVDAVPGSDVAQLSAWARIRRDAGFRALYVMAHLDGRLVGGALVLERRLPVVGRIGYVSNGPIISGAAPRELVVDRLLTAMDALARTRLHALFVQPPVDAPDISTGLRERGFRHSAAGIAPTASIHVDLRRDIDDLRGRLTKANRRRTRNWAQRGVTVRVGSSDDAALVAELLARTAEHQHFEPLSPGYIETLFRELDSDHHAAVFVAECEGAPAAALLCTRCNGTVKQRISGMDRSEHARKDGVSAATVWHAMLWAKSQGYDTYDFGGLRADAARVLLEDRAQPTVHLTGSEQFKTSFGGEVFLYPEQVELISFPPLRLAYDVSRHTRTGGRILEVGKRALRGGRVR
jgi:lipid II:glycine glycyltransferase (peptidoglycan interpeptide bridge formation enzyme)